MNYFILIYHVIIGSSKSEFVTVGRVVPDLDYTPNVIRDKVIEAVREQYPDEPVTAKLHDKKQVTQTLYEKQTANFNIELK